MSAAATKENSTETPSKKPTLDDTLTVKLSRPITTHEGEVKELVLKEPSGRLVLKHGLPWKTIFMGGGGDQGEDTKFEVEFVPSKMVVFLEEMSGVDRETLGEISARDMNALFLAVLTMLQSAGN